jgi:phytoene desaturase
VNGQFIEADLVLGSADYHHVETLLPAEFRSYSTKYWESRKMAPSALLFYLGVNKKLKNLEHHNLFFDTDFDKHAHEIYTQPGWPEQPAIYVSCSSKTDPGVAPEGHENVIILIPVAPGLKDTEELKEKYFKLVMERLERITEQSIEPHVVFRKMVAQSDFIREYNAFKGNAYGLSNTLLQTAILKPSLKSKKLHNLFFAGQLTVPGPGVPPALISGRVVAKEVQKYFKDSEL